MTRRPTRTRRRAIRRQTASFFALLLGTELVLWTLLDRVLCHRWLLEPDEALLLGSLALATTAAFWWRRRFG